MSVLIDHHEWPSLHDRWNDLLETNSTLSIFQTFEWCDAWHTAYGKLFRTQMIADDSTSPRWLFPSTLRPTLFNGCREQELMPLGIVNQAADYGEIITRGEAMDISFAIEELLCSANNETVLTLSNIREDTPTFSALEEALIRTKTRFWKVKLYDAPEIDLTAPQIAADLLGRKSLQRHKKALEKIGGLSYEIVETRERIEKLLPLFFEQHRRRRRFVGDVSIFEKQESQEFFFSLVDRLYPKGWLHFSVVWLREQPVAFHFGFRYRKKLYWYTPCFDPDFAKQSPGEVLLHFLFEHVLAEGYETFDFTVGNEAFKYRFANQIKEVFRFRIYRRRHSHLLQKVRNGYTLSKKQFRALFSSVNNDM